MQDKLDALEDYQRRPILMASENTHEVFAAYDEAVKVAMRRIRRREREACLRLVHSSHDAAATRGG